MTVFWRRRFRMARLVNLRRRADLLALLLILFAAAAMRLGRSGVVEYFHDDAMLTTLALEMAAGERFPLTGILSSTGIPNPPTSVYVMAIPFSLSSDPNAAIHFIMLLNVGGVGLLWLMARRYFGRRAALIAGLAYAVNPWAVLFSRKIWAPGFSYAADSAGAAAAAIWLWGKGAAVRLDRSRLESAAAAVCFPNSLCRLGAAAAYSDGAVAGSKADCPIGHDNCRFAVVFGFAALFDGAFANPEPRSDADFGCCAAFGGG